MDFQSRVWRNDAKIDVKEWLEDFKAKADAFGVKGEERYQVMLGSLAGSVISTILREARLMGNDIPRKEEERVTWLEKEL
jgi:hypothetical protein